MKKYRAALIGCGFFSVNHMHAWQEISNVDVVAICDSDRERLDIIGNQFNISARYESAEALFASGGFDFVDIATTVESHIALVTLAADYKIPVICQKPFAKTLQGARQMVCATEAAGVPLMVHENFRWQSPIQAVRRVINNGEIGKPFWGRFSFRSAYDVFSGQPYLAEGDRFIIEDLGIHTLDIARFLMGDVKTVTARTTRVNPNIAGEDVATILLDHESGSHSMVDCSYATKLAEELFPQTLVEIDGTDGSVRLGKNYQLEVVTGSGVRTEDVSPPLLSWASKPWHNIQESVLAIQQHWVDCLENNTTPVTSGEDNVRTLELVEAAYDSAKTQKSVSIDELANHK